MPAYDVLLMAKASLGRRDLAELAKGVAARVLSQEGVITHVKSLGRVPLAYDIKKRDGWHQEGNLLQLSVMAVSSLAKDLQYLNKDERMLRWMVVHSRGQDWMKMPQASSSFGPSSSAY